MKLKKILAPKKILALFVMAFAGTLLSMAADKPQYPGGDEALNKYITTNLKYPQVAKDNGIEGIVGVQFLVKEDGSIGSIKIIRMVDPDLEQEAVRLVKNMPAWIPADKDGSPVEAPAQVNVPFILE